jgi:hypothetical protein
MLNAECDAEGWVGCAACLVTINQHSEVALAQPARECGQPHAEAASEIDQARRVMACATIRA